MAIQKKKKRAKNKAKKQTNAAERLLNAKPKPNLESPLDDENMAPPPPPAPSSAKVSGQRKSSAEQSFAKTDQKCAAALENGAGGFVSDSPGEEEDEELLGSDDDEQEDPKDYKRGGYHPVNIGDVFHGRYHVIRKIGWGHFSTVWLCWDVTCKRFVAMKIVKSASHYTETALDEIKLLTCVRDSDMADPRREQVVRLLDDFKIGGVNGEHVCMVFEVLGHNLLKLIIRSHYRGIPLNHVRAIIRQVLEGLAYLHSKCKIIHTDIKPENVLICLTPEQIKSLALDSIKATKAGVRLSASATSTAPRDLQTQLQKTMSKNKKKKLKRKMKKNRQKLETELAELHSPLDNDAGEDGEVAFCLLDELRAIAGLNQDDDVEVCNEEDSPMLMATSAQADQLAARLAAQKLTDGGDRNSVPNPINETADKSHVNASSSITIAPNEQQPSSNLFLHRHRSSSLSRSQFATLTDERDVSSATIVADKSVSPSSSRIGDDETQLTTASDFDSSTVTSPDDFNNRQNGPSAESSKKPIENGLESHLDSTRELLSNTEATLSNDKNNFIANRTYHSVDNETAKAPCNGSTKPSPKSPMAVAIATMKNSIVTQQPLPQHAPTLQRPSELDFKPLLDAADWTKMTESQKHNFVVGSDSDSDVADCDQFNVSSPSSITNQYIVNTPDVQDSRFSTAPSDLKVKIADLGNACWVHHHYTDDIQTRQYRSLEVLIGAGYDCPADIWSTACMAFELATGDYLFEPHSGNGYTRDEDHLAHVIELMGPIPKHIFMQGKYHRQYFTKTGDLRNISKLKPWNLKSVLTEKYEWPSDEAEQFSAFLMPMLEYDQRKRASADQCLQQPWLKVHKSSKTLKSPRTPKLIIPKQKALL